MFPWMALVPEALRNTLHWAPVEVPNGRFLILLYPGKRDGGSLDEEIESLNFADDLQLVALDTVMDSPGNVLDFHLWNWLCTLASLGKVLGVVGGSMCRTWSIRRHIPKPGGGLPLRDRLGVLA